jgi:polyisoprenoid-binding protein YceI
MSQTATDTRDLTGTYVIDSTHSRFGFVARHAMVTKVRGSFGDFTGTLTIDGDDPTKSTGELTIVATSIHTGNEQRDGHLRSNDFFDMENHPELTYKSTGVEHVGGNEFKVTGDLTIKGVTKSVTLDVEYTGAATDPFGNPRIGFEGTTVINRKDWGVNWNASLEAGGVLVSEKVTLDIDISAIKQADEAAQA